MRDYLPLRGLHHQHFGTGADEQPVARTIEKHPGRARPRRDRPARFHALRGHVDDVDLILVLDVDEDLPAPSAWPLSAVPVSGIVALAFPLAASIAVADFPV